MSKVAVVLFVAGLATLASCSHLGTVRVEAQYSETLNSTVILNTSMGNITIELFEDMPITTSNFKNLTELGIYDGTIFHRVVHGFVIQGGDPTGTGYGDPSISTILDELPNKHSNVRGSVAMAKTDAPNSASSQFYINLVDNLDLDSTYTVFGQVVAGMNVVDSIGNVQTDVNDRPLQPVTVLTARLSGFIPEFSLIGLAATLIVATIIVIGVCRTKHTVILRSKDNIAIDESE
jgi:peptidylprolyl isomerase